MTIRKLLLGMIGASVLLAALVSTAAARNFSSSSQTLRSLFSAVTFNVPFGNVVCEVQLEGSLHNRTIAKVVGSLIGYITEARILRCAENSATILRATLPWHVRYAGFTGTLPNISTIRINVVGAAFQIENGTVNCLAQSTAERPARGTFNREAGGALTTAEIEGEVPTNCFFNGTFRSNRAAVTVLNAATRITVTLI